MVSSTTTDVVSSSRLVTAGQQELYLYQQIRSCVKKSAFVSLLAVASHAASFRVLCSGVFS